MNYYHNIWLYALRTIKVQKVGLWTRMKRRISIFDKACVIIVTLTCSIRLISSLLYFSCIIELKLFIIMFHNLLWKLYSDIISSTSSWSWSAWHNHSSRTCVAFSSATKQGLSTFAGSIPENPQKLTAPPPPRPVQSCFSSKLCFAGLCVTSTVEKSMWDELIHVSMGVGLLYQVIRPYLLQWSRNVSLLKISKFNTVSPEADC
jgi:hypothetical protein